MELRYVTREQMPDGHEWAIIENEQGVTVLAVDSFAAKIAALVVKQRSAH